MHGNNAMAIRACCPTSSSPMEDAISSLYEEVSRLEKLTEGLCGNLGAQEVRAGVNEANYSNTLRGELCRLRDKINTCNNELTEVSGRLGEEIGELKIL